LVAVANLPPQPFFSVYFGPLNMPLALKSAQLVMGASPLSGSLAFQMTALVILVAISSR
jgi:hypothetical protein